IEADDVLLGLAHLFVATRRDRPARRIDEMSTLGGLDLLGEEPFAGLALVRFVAYHALRKQPGKRLVEIEIPAPLQRAGEEARVKQVENRVLDTADVLVDRHPIIDRLALKCDRRTRRAEAQEIPGRFE